MPSHLFVCLKLNTTTQHMCAYVVSSLHIVAKLLGSSVGREPRELWVRITPKVVHFSSKNDCLRCVVLYSMIAIRLCEVSMFIFIGSDVTQIWT